MNPERAAYRALAPGVKLESTQDEEGHWHFKATLAINHEEMIALDKRVKERVFAGKLQPNVMFDKGDAYHYMHGTLESSVGTFAFFSQMQPMRTMLDYVHKFNAEHGMKRWEPAQLTSYRKHEVKLVNYSERGGSFICVNTVLNPDIGNMRMCLCDWARGIALWDVHWNFVLVVMISSACCAGLRVVVWPESMKRCLQYLFEFTSSKDVGGCGIDSEEATYIQRLEGFVVIGGIVGVWEWDSGPLQPHSCVHVHFT